MRSSIETDSGGYVNGVYTTKNGKTNSEGLGCPKGVRLYDPNMIDAVYFQPDDIGETETFELITRNVAPDILPYYAVSNYGRIMNIRSGKIIKPNYRSNGYEYVCLAADNCKNGQKKYSTHRVMLGTFYQRDDMSELTVNHKNLNKADNYVDKMMPDGSIESNLEWATSSENAIHRNFNSDMSTKLTYDAAREIRAMHEQGYSYEQIRNNGYDFVSSTTIQNVCKNVIFKDELYVRTSYPNIVNKNPGNVHKLLDADAERIRYLHSKGYNCKEIKEKFFPDFSESTISDVVRNITHCK